MQALPRRCHKYLFMSVQPEGKSHPHAPSSFEIKSAQLSSVVLLLRSLDIQKTCADLTSQFGPGSENSDFFDHEAAVLDLAVFKDQAFANGFAALLESMRQCQLVPMATRNAPASWKAALLSLGLVEASLPSVPQKSMPQALASSQPVAKALVAVKELGGARTMVIDKPLRSGQKIYARGGDLIVLAMVNQGAEVVADGNIHVYAPLRGKAMAGVRGDVQARIFSTCLEPELVSIAGVYRTSETPFAKDIASKAAQVYLSADGLEKLIIEPLKT